MDGVTSVMIAEHKSRLEAPANVCQKSKISQVQKMVNLKPQITKEYVESQAAGRPDFSILDDYYESGHKFYEPQYSIIPNRRLFHESEESFKRAGGSQLRTGDEQLEKANVQFRETPSQDQHQRAVLQRIQAAEQDQLYDSFM